MKVKHLAAVTLCAELALAVPYGLHHRHLHNKRAIVTTYATLTDIVTVTDHNAVVWVDNAGNVVRTDYKTPATATAPESASSVTLSSVSVSASTFGTATVPSTSTSTPKTDNNVDPTTTPTKVVPENGALPTRTAEPTNKKDTGTVNTGNTVNSVNSAATIGGFGVAYDAYSGTGAGCRPNLDSEFAFLASQGASMVRVYDMCFAESINAASSHNLKLMIGLTSFQNFDANLNNLVKAVTSTKSSWSVIDTVFIGNELVNSRAASSAEVAAKVSYARGILKTRGFSGSVVTVDTWTAMRADPTICSTSDYCAANAHAYFDGNVAPSDAGKFVRMAQSQVAAKNGNKRVVITESGWPHAGAAFNKAVPGVENQRAAMASIITEFSSTPADMFLFMAYDAKYKTSAVEVERNFGIFDADHFNGSL